MQIAVPREILSGERRVALVPEQVGKLVAAGHTVVVENGAGAAAGYADDAYAAAGATLVKGAAAVYRGAQVVLKVQRPQWNSALEAHETDRIEPGALVMGLLRPHGDAEGIQRLASRGITAVAVELVPRSTRAQSMDVLSSQATVVGYKAALNAANALPKFFPMLMTAAGTVRPSTVLVLGAGVAGLQAIATCKRLGAVVEAFDTRPVVKEQVKSLGAKFIELELGHGDGEGEGGYAKALSAEHLRREMDLIASHVAKADVVITTAQIPGRPAPVLITQETVERMRPGSVIVDLAAESGGNCECSDPGKTIVHEGVTIMAPFHLASELATHASQLYAKNVATLLLHLLPSGPGSINLADDIVSAVVVAHGGEIRFAPTRGLLGLAPVEGAK